VQGSATPRQRADALEEFEADGDDVGDGPGTHAKVAVDPSRVPLKENRRPSIVACGSDKSKYRETSSSDSHMQAPSRLTSTPEALASTVPPVVRVHS